jgi:polyhydroxybutyrate depolymerase
VHGLNDRTMPMQGRAIGGWHQGDTMKGFEILRALDRCRAEPDIVQREGDLECRRWTSCGSGRELQLCLHQGDHDLSGQWLRDGVVWALGLRR